MPTRMLDKSPCHSSDKPWLTPRIKQEIKARQLAYTRGYIVEYKERCKKVSRLVTKAKLRYYKTKVENAKHSNQSKWYKNIYKLAVAEESGGTIPKPETVVDIQRDYKVPSQNHGKISCPLKSWILMRLFCR